MVKIVEALTVELDLLHDALDDVDRIMRALVRRHGQRFRELEARIEHLADSDDWGEPRIHLLGTARLVVEPFPALKSIIRDARDLEVI